MENSMDNNSQYQVPKQKSNKKIVLVSLSVFFGVVFIGLVGWIVYNIDQNYKNDIASKEQQVTDLQQRLDSLEHSQSANKERQVNTDDQQEYVDLRQNQKDGTGIVLNTAADIEKLTGVGAELKKYFEENIGKSVDTPFGGGRQPMTFTVDRLYGNYAVGKMTGVPAYVAWGPKASNGAIDRVAGTQNLGMDCDALSAAKVPKELVDSKCLVEGEGLKAYEG